MIFRDNGQLSSRNTKTKMFIYLFVMSSKDEDVASENTGNDGSLLSWFLSHWKYPSCLPSWFF